MDIDANDLIATLTKQRETQATEAAMMAAACEGLKRTVADLEARLAILQATPAQSDPSAPTGPVQ